MFGLFLLVASPLFAATFRVGEVYEQKDAVVNDDLYIAGGSVDISGNVSGDVIMAGGDVALLGNVTQDVMSAGGTLNLVGAIGDDLRAVGGNISVASRVADDLVAVGGFVKVLSDSTVSGDAVLAGGAVIMNATIVGDLTVYGEEVTVNGPVNGDVTLRFTRKVTLGPDARIGGNFTYSADEELTIPEGVFIGGEVTRVESGMAGFNKKSLAQALGFFAFGKFLMILVAVLLLVLVFKRASHAVGTHTVDHFWKHALLGLVGLIVTPIIAFLLFVSFIGVFIGIFLLLLYILTLLAAGLYTSVAAGALLSKWAKQRVIIDWMWAVIGLVATFIVCFVPVIGPLVVFVIFLSALGTIGTIAHRKLWVAR